MKQIKYDKTAYLDFPTLIPEEKDEEDYYIKDGVIYER